MNLFARILLISGIRRNSEFLIDTLHFKIVR